MSEARALKKVEKFSAKLYQAFIPFENCIISKDIARQLALRADFIFDKLEIFNNVFPMILQFESQTLTATVADTLSRQIAARIAELEARVIPAFGGIIVPEWTPLEIIDIKDATWKEDQRGQQLSFLCLSGTAAGHVITRKFPEKWLAYLAYQIGFNKRMNYNYEPNVFLGLRISGLLIQSQRDEGQTDIQEWRISAHMKKRNVGILKLRTRYDKLHKMGPDCPSGLDNECKDCMKDSKQCEASYIRINNGRSKLDAGAPKGSPERSLTEATSR